MRYFFYSIISTLLIVAGCSSGDNESKKTTNNQTDSIIPENKIFLADNPDSLFFFIETANANDTIIIVDKIEINSQIIIKNKKNLVIMGDYGLLSCKSCHECLILIDSSENISIENLEIHGENPDTLSGSMINIKQSKNIRISKNNIGHYTEYGIRILKDCDSIAITENTIQNNNSAGIEVLSINTTISSNIFYNNGNGKKDILFAKKIEEQCISENNEFRLVDHSDYIAETDKKIKQKILTEKQSIAPDGIENISGFYDDDKLVHITYTYSEEDEQSVSVYLIENIPVFILSQNTSYKAKDEKTTATDKFYFLKGNIVKWEQIAPDKPDTLLIEEPKLITKKQKELKNSVSYYIQALEKTTDPE